MHRKNVADGPSGGRVAEGTGLRFHRLFFLSVRLARLPAFALGARKPPPTALTGAKNPRNTQKRCQTIRLAMDSGGCRSPRDAPTPPHGRFGPRQRLAHRRGHVDGPCTQLHHPYSGTCDLGPDCDGFWPRASILPLKFGSQSNLALVLRGGRGVTFQ